MKPTIHASQDTARFVFNPHAEELRRRAVAWFSERQATLGAKRRALVLERLLFDPRTDSITPSLAIELSLSFQRTLRVPDDGRDYPLPAGLGRLPFRAVRRLSSPAVPKAWRDRPTAVVPLHPAEATWLSFDARRPFAVQIAAGGVCAASGLPHQERLVREPQNYLSVPAQPWLDGFRVDPSTVRQFVAMPLGHGYTVESQVTGAETRGGLQIRVVPLKVDVLWKHHVLIACKRIWAELTAPPRTKLATSIQAMRGGVLDIECCTCSSVEEMGFGAGGRIRQKIYADPIAAEDWDESAALNCEVQLVPAAQWAELTGERVPTEPPTPAQYAAAGIPWFDYASNASPVATPSAIAGIKSVDTIFKAKSGLHLPDNQSISIPKTTVLSAAG